MAAKGNNNLNGDDSFIYRRYQSKEEFVADAIESLREEIEIPNTGNFWEDINMLIQNAAQIPLSPLGRQTVNDSQ